MVLDWDSRVRGDEAIGMMPHSSYMELAAAGDAAHRGVGSLPPSWLALQDLGLTTGNCDATHARLLRQGISGAQLELQLYEWLFSLVVLVLALAGLGPFLSGCLAACVSELLDV